MSVLDKAAIFQKIRSVLGVVGDATVPSIYREGDLQISSAAVAIAQNSHPQQRRSVVGGD
jgi:hypothetical protein